MLFLAVSTKTALTVGAILGATVAIAKNRDELLDVAVDCLQKCASTLNNLKRNKYDVKCDRNQQNLNSKRDNYENEEVELKGTRENNVRLDLRDFTRSSRRIDSGSEMTTPDSSDWELLSDSRESLVDLMRSQSYDTIHMASID